MPFFMKYSYKIFQTSKMMSSSHRISTINYSIDVSIGTNVILTRKLGIMLYRIRTNSARGDNK